MILLIYDVVFRFGLICGVYIFARPAKARSDGQLF